MNRTALFRTPLLAWLAAVSFTLLTACGGGQSSGATPDDGAASGGSGAGAGTEAGTGATDPQAGTDSDASDTDTHADAGQDGSSAGGDTSGDAGSVVPAGVPLLATVADQHARQGTRYTFQPQLTRGGRVNWSKTLGPDTLQVDPLTGQVSWTIAATLPSESFYVGVQASNALGVAQQVWIVHVGVAGVVHVGPAEDSTTLAQAFANHPQPGLTFVVRNGRYSGEANSIARLANGEQQRPGAGTATALTTVMAEDPGEVTLDGGALIDLNGINGAYGWAAFKGFFVKDGSITTTGYTGEHCTQAGGCRPHHIKFTHNGVESAGDIAYNAFRSDDILFENNYAFGGGRYKFASYQAQRVVMRRNVARYDRSNNEMAEPKGTYSIYTTLDALVANNLAVDGDQSRFITQGQLAGEFTCPTTSGPTRVVLERNMQLNSEMLYGNMDDQTTSGGGTCRAEVRDVVSWDVRPADVYVMTRGVSWLDHITMGKIAPRATHVDQLFNGWVSSAETGQTRGLTNALLHDITRGDLFYNFYKEGSTRYGVDTVNISATPGTRNVYNSTLSHISEVDPIYSDANPSGGLRYLTRIEAGSNLSGRAKDGGDLGATVMTFKGRAGTFWGDSGYADETQQPMWPFPLEDVMQAKMAAYRYTGTTYSGSEYARVASGSGTLSGERGFAVPGQTLTHYVWGYLGQVVPPFNVHAGVQNGKIVVLWDQHAPTARAAITGYNVYRIDNGSRIKLNATVLTANSVSFEISGLPAGRSYELAVTALRGASESGFSYPARVTLP